MLPLLPKNDVIDIIFPPVTAQLIVSHRQTLDEEILANRCHFAVLIVKNSNQLHLIQATIRRVIFNIFLLSCQ